MLMELRPRGYSILPPIVKNLIIINVLFFIATFIFQRSMNIDLNQYLALRHWGAVDAEGTTLFRPWQLITHMFMHDSRSLGHIFFNMFGLWMFGSIIENRFGPKRFLQLYIYAGLGAAVVHLLMLTVESQYAGSGVLYTSAIGASGAVYAVLFAFGYLFPNSLVHLYFFIPVKAKYVIMALVAYDLFSGLTGTSNIAHFAHLGGMLTAFIIFKIWRIRYDSA